ncbi:hypothetical protein R3W88_004514 [Solanum pinnatisectum]|uniref:peroxidase n=1 Tax=Solanum pinnatisectum TaxID=50273 RepID=A0AAV9K9Z0_9SOLN|nr:hypothetical protein R3W88_004514 [Solanum pinnatisectum]
MTSKALFFAVLLFTALSAFAEEKEDGNPGLVMDYYKRTCPQAEDIIKEQVNVLYKQQQSNAFSWLRNVFHDCFVEVQTISRSHSFLHFDEHFKVKKVSFLIVLWVQSCSHSVFFPQCIKLVQHLYPEVVPQLNPEHIPHILKKCPYSIPDSKAMQYVRNDKGTPMKLDNNYYRNILDNKGLMLVDQQLAVDKRTRLYVKKMAKNQDYFKKFARAITVLSENNPLTGTKGEIRKQCYLANQH